MDEEAVILMLLDSYGLEDLLEEVGITQEAALEALVDSGLVDLSDFMEDH